ncbi:MAG: hypothetical protein ACLGGX_09735 [Bdellovibrionia bacterium]
MHKEINPELFGERIVAKNPVATATPPGGALDQQVLQQERQIADLRKQNHMLAEQLNKVIATLNEHMKNSGLKLERTTQGLTRLEQSHNGMVQETAQKLGQLNQRFQERKAIDQKIQEMVDRHNNVIKSFEVRMNHMQKLLSEKENQAQAALTALNDAKMEIARLKRL